VETQVRAAIARCLEGQFELRPLDPASVFAGARELYVTQRFRAERAVITFAAELQFAGRWVYSVVSVEAEPPYRRSWAQMPAIGYTEPPDWAWVRVEVEEQFREAFLDRFLESMDQQLPTGTETSGAPSTR
jgi:hypothetical protein